MSKFIAGFLLVTWCYHCGDAGWKPQWVTQTGNNGANLTQAECDRALKTFHYGSSEIEAFEKDKLRNVDHAKGGHLPWCLAVLKTY